MDTHKQLLLEDKLITAQPSRPVIWERMKSTGPSRNLVFWVDLGYKRFASREYSVSEAQKVGLLVGSYTVDDRDEMKKQLSEGVDFITTNEPELLFEVLEEQKRSRK